jgi:hypothetical protein
VMVGVSILRSSAKSWSSDVCTAESGMAGDSPFCGFVLRAIDGRRQGFAVAGQKRELPLKPSRLA